MLFLRLRAASRNLRPSSRNSEYLGQGGQAQQEGREAEWLRGQHTTMPAGRTFSGQTALHCSFLKDARHGHE